MKTCESCKWWSDRQSSMACFSFGDDIGECRKKAPCGPIQYHPEGGVENVKHIVNSFVPTAKDDWCGEHKERAND